MGSFDAPVQHTDGLPEGTCHQTVARAHKLARCRLVNRLNSRRLHPRKNVSLHAWVVRAKDGARWGGDRDSSSAPFATDEADRDADPGNLDRLRLAFAEPIDALANGRGSWNGRSASRLSGSQVYVWHVRVGLAYHSIHSREFRHQDLPPFRRWLGSLP